MLLVETIQAIADVAVFRYIPSWDSRATLRSSSRPKDVSSASWPSGNSSLGRRQLDQDVPPEMDDYCIWRCTIATCGCNLQSSLTAVTRRSVSLLTGTTQDPHEQWNNSTVDIGTTLDHRDSRLVARWPGASEPADQNQQRFTRAQLDTYIPTILNDNSMDNGYFGTSRQFLVVGPPLCVALHPLRYCPGAMSSSLTRSLVDS